VALAAYQSYDVLMDINTTNRGDTMNDYQGSVNVIWILAHERAELPEDELDFYAAAIELGCSEEQAERADMILIERILRANGLI